MMMKSLARCTFTLCDSSFIAAGFYGILKEEDDQYFRESSSRYKSLYYKALLVLETGHR